MSTPKWLLLNNIISSIIKASGTDDDEVTFTLSEVYELDGVSELFGKNSNSISWENTIKNLLFLFILAKPHLLKTSLNACNNNLKSIHYDASSDVVTVLVKLLAEYESKYKFDKAKTTEHKDAVIKASNEMKDENAELKDKIEELSNKVISLEAYIKELEAELIKKGGDITAVSKPIETEPVKPKRAYKKKAVASPTNNPAEPVDA